MKYPDKYILEGNETIGSFIGIKVNTKHSDIENDGKYDIRATRLIRFCDRIYYDVLTFDSDWNWLLVGCNQFYTLNNLDNHNHYLNLRSKLRSAIVEINIEKTFEQLVRNIKWYNKNYKS